MGRASYSWDCEHCEGSGKFLKGTDLSQLASNLMLTSLMCVNTSDYHLTDMGAMPWFWTLRS